METGWPTSMVAWLMALWDRIEIPMGLERCGFGGRCHPQIAWAKLESLYGGVALGTLIIAAPEAH